MYKLSDNQQAVIMLLVFILPAFLVWITGPDPLMEEQSLRMLIAAVISGVLVFLKEIAGYKPKEN